MSFLATVALIFVQIVRPQEIWPALAALRLLDVLTLLAAAGVLFEFLVSKRDAVYWSPQLPFLVAFLGISYLATILNVGIPGIALATQRALLGAVFMLVVMYGAMSIARLRGLMVVLGALAIFVCGVAVHQAGEERQCIEVPPERPDAVADGIPDGRVCESAHACSIDGHDDAQYACERLGLFRTASIAGRVRWRGQLNDPNELSVFVGAVVPFFMAYGRSRRRLAWPIALALIGTGLYAIVLTQSRGGQLVIATVFAFVFGRRFGVKGLVLAGLVALPVLVLGGRSGETADASKTERIELLYAGVTFVKTHPVFGIGIDQFNEAQRHTAHNAYLLAASELGLPGFFAWTGMLWSSLKILAALVQRPPPGMDPAFRQIALAFIASFAGMAVGIFFLSFTFKQLLFIWLGMTGALYGAVRKEHPSFEVGSTPRDYAGIAAVDAAILVLLFVFTRHHAP